MSLSSSLSLENSLEVVVLERESPLSIIQQTFIKNLL